MSDRLHRRDVLQSAVAAGAVAAGVAATSAVAQAADGPAATKGNINHSIVFWCFNVMGDKWDLDKTC